MPKQTPLYATHLAAGAKMVDFAGWDMPIHYGSQLEEHHQVRRGAGMFDVSHMLVLDVGGAGARDFLRHLLANDVARLRLQGKALYSCMLNAQGGVIDDLIVYYFGPEHYRLVVNAGTADSDLAWMRNQLARLAGGNASLEPRRDLGLIAVQGPLARALTHTALPGSAAAADALEPFQAVPWQDFVLCRTGYTGEDGYELMVPVGRLAEVWSALAGAGVRPAGLGARDTLRLEAGMNLYGQDMDETVSPLESGLAWTVDFAPERAFIGRAALEGQHPARILVGLLLQERGVLRAHMPVHTPLGEGQTTSGSYAPTLNASIALARVPAGIVPGQQVDVEVRGKRLSALVVKPPFARNGRALV